MVSDKVIDSRLEDPELLDLYSGFGEVLDTTDALWEEIRSKSDTKTILDRAIRVSAMIQRLVEDNNLTGEHQ